MTQFFKKSFFIWYVSYCLFFITILPSQSQALFLSHPDAVPVHSEQRTLELKKIQSLLESKLLRQRLLDFGLSEEEISSRLNQLTDQEIHQITTHLDSLIPGGDSGLGIIVALLVIAILVVILLQLTGHKIIITK